jgi:alkylated DNA repair dioxygenase AlkB
VVNEILSFQLQIFSVKLIGNNLLVSLALKESLSLIHMNLFDLPFDSSKNLLPHDGEVYYYGKIHDQVKSDQQFSELLTKIEWKHDESIIAGKHIVTKRKVAWYGDRDFKYTYSNTTKKALPWTKQLLELKHLIEQRTNETFNSCLMNLYHNGDEGVSWHSDDEKALKRNGAIASLSFGAERKFAFKHKDNKERVDILLEHGGLLIMTGLTQTNWLHSIPKTKKVTTPRISLTFRSIINPE